MLGVDRLGHRPALDGLRGVAILLVVVAHTFDRRYGFFAGGALGVDLFFVLSGFLITTLLLEEHEETGAISIRNFYTRRARRLLPALVALVLTAAAIEISTGALSAALVHAAVRLSYVANYLAVANAQLLGNGFGHLWSLGLEEQFYIVWPLLLAALLRRRTSPRRLILLLVGGILIVNLIRIGVAPDGNWRRVNYLPDTHGDVIMFGCLAAIIWKHRRIAVPRSGVIGSIVVMAGMVAWFRETTPLYLLPLPFFAIAACLLLFAALEPQSSVANVLQNKLLVGAGRMSYSVYLWHVPLIGLLGPVGIFPAVALSWISYRFIEQLFRRKKRAYTLAGATT